MRYKYLNLRLKDVIFFFFTIVFRFVLKFFDFFLSVLNPEPKNTLRCFFSVINTLSLFLVFIFVLYFNFIFFLFKRPANILNSNKFLICDFLIIVVNSTGEAFYLFFIIIIGYYYK